MECSKPWTANENQWIKHHAGDGAAVLAHLLGREPRDVILHGLEIGVDVAPRPEMGEYCPWCGRRMTRFGTGYRFGGICEACWYRHLQDVQNAARAERQAKKEWNTNKVDNWRARDG